MAVIQFNDVWEMYKLKLVIANKASWENFWALKGISFSINQGETVGLIGENGAGKSTILKLISGMIKPDRGEVKVLGRLSGLLELGAGFQPELTGKENIYLNASLFGWDRDKVEKNYDEIVVFADIGKFINAPTQCYSQGMLVRLAFAVAIHIDSEILLIDDTLAVGDEYFQNKCIKKIFELKDLGKTIILVSHDMNMLSRLCKRAIFLKDGRIIKDSQTDKVIALYNQTFGIKEGVCILEKQPLSIIFNNGRFIINWKDKLLTSNSGVYTAFLINNKWFNSLQADWEVKKENDFSFVAKGQFFQLSLTFIWRLEIGPDHMIKWGIEIDSKGPVEIQEGAINIMLPNEYTGWFTNFEKGRFPLIESKSKHWQAVLSDNINNKFIGVNADEFDVDKAPALIFEQLENSNFNRAQLFNADSYANCRILQYKTLRLQNFSAEITSSFLYSSGKIIIDVKDIDAYVKKINDEFVISEGKIKLTFDKGAVALCYDGIDLTKAEHFNTAVLINGRWFSSNLADWEVKKEDENKLIVKCKWQGLPIVQIWEMEINDGSSFLWKVKLEASKEVNIEEQHVLFMCSKDYKYWFCDYGSGNFPDEFIEIQTDMFQRIIPDGTIGLMSQNNQIPNIALKFSKELKNFAEILNSDFYCRARVLRVQRVEPETATRFLPGVYDCFMMEVNLYKKEEQICGKSLTGVLQKNKLRFVFDKGKGRMYFDGVELTKNLGLYTSLRSLGRWHDSVSFAVWKIEEQNDDTLRLAGKWLHLPVNQYWQISLKDENIFEFNVKMLVNKEIEVDRLQVNVMLLEKYSQWLTDSQKGAFPSFKEDVDSDWDCVWQGEDNTKCIGVFQNSIETGSLPAVRFSFQNSNSNCCLNIVNSDIYHRARVLQSLNNHKMVIPPGEYHYFSGNIAINI